MLGTDRSHLVTKPIAANFPFAYFKPVALAVAAFCFLMGVWYVAQVVVLDYSAAAAVGASLKSSSAPVKPDEPIQVKAMGAGVELDSVQLYRADLADDGSRSPEQRIGVRIQPAGDEGTWQVLPADPTQRLLRPDGVYRLSVRAAAPRPAIPLPRTSLVEQDYRFSTVASPHARVPAGTLTPRWAEPVSLSWSEPMQSVITTVDPAAPITTWIDPSDSRKAWVQIGATDGAGLADGQTYEVHITQAEARNGIPLQKPIAFKVQVPRRPRFVDPPQDPVTLRFGDNYTLKSSMELAGVQVATSDGATARVVVNKSDIRVDAPDFQQGATFDVAVTSAASLEGAPLAEPVTVRFVTPPALATPTIAPEDGSIGVQPADHPSITFAEPVADQNAATQALQIDPQVPGHWAWTSPKRVEFVPDARLPILSDITIGVSGGPAGPRAAAGGYLAKDVLATFHTTDFKRMDVSLSRQTMTLTENDVPIRTISVATGVAAAPTPTGTFSVQYKSPQMRFKGVNPDGSHYDIPDVNWVMPFWGDYTIHGAYWRPRFGVPGSDGCISMTDADAKMLYDWADVGTPIVIHN